MRATIAIVGLTLILGGCTGPELVTVEGVVTAVDGDLRTVRSFNLLTTDGETIRVFPAPFGEFSFPLPHLGSHMRSLDPVRVVYRTAEDGVFLAEEIDDVPTGESP